MTLHVILLEDTDTTENHTEIPQRKLTLTLSVSSDWDGEGVCGGGGGGGGVEGRWTETSFCSPNAFLCLMWHLVRD